MEDQLIYKLSNREAFIRKATEAIASCLNESIEEQGTAHVLLSGGSTPGPIYKKLADDFEQLSKVKIGLVDERFIETSSEFSNERLLRECFSGAASADQNIEGMVHDTKDQQNNLRLLNQKYELFTKRIDLVVLGMGGDGHTASIFPNDPSSDEARSSEAPFFNTLAPVNPQQRITFGMPLLCRAKHIFIFITGEKKWDVLNDNSAQLPIHELMGRRNDIKLFYTE